MADLAMGGKLLFNSTSQLKFVPFGGNYIKLAGVLRQIPATGVLVGTTSVLINGASGNLAANTTYLVNLIDVAGALTLEFRTTLTHAPSQSVGNEGVEVWNADVTRSVVGIIRTDAAGVFQDNPAQRFVSSWYNPVRRLLQGAALASTVITGGNQELGPPNKRVEWAAFDREMLDVSLACNVSNNTANFTTVLNVYISPLGVYGPENAYTTSAANSVGCVSTRYCNAIAIVGEGYGYAAPYGSCYSGGTATFGQVLLSGGQGLVGHLTG